MDREKVLQAAREAGFDVHPRKGEIRSPHDMMAVDITAIVSSLYAIAYEAGRKDEREKLDAPRETVYLSADERARLQAEKNDNMLRLLNNMPLK
jgi:hypothetical protein